MAQQIQDDNKFTKIRLPSSIKPLHYDLWLRPDLKEFTFQGTVKIEFKLLEPASEVTLHSKNLQILDGHLTTENEPKHQPLIKVSYSSSTDTATLDFGQPLKESGLIFLTFKGVLNDKMKGFYRTEFVLKDSKGVEVKAFAASTQFEPTFARQCFPCWDEPAFKATFSTTLCYDPKFYSTIDDSIEAVALSNTPIVSKSKPEIFDDELNVHFAKTPIMSTYLVAFIIGPLESIEDYAGSHLVRVFTKPGTKEHGRFALEIACKSILFYENYFNIKYPLEKLDMVAVPDFLFGAMENWGLVTYRDRLLLVDPKNTSTYNKQNVALVVAHELAHQWFGNLVTMKWWTHLWLNEGFATFMEYLCIDHVAPEFEIWSQFVTECYVGAMNLDSLRNSHPIEVPVEHPDEIDEIFDSISYNKGSSVIRMLYEYIGDESFKKGMHRYLSKFAYQNAQTEDLWASLESASDKPVAKLMSFWTKQQGYPWLSVTLKETQGEDVALIIGQSKFFADGKLMPEDSDIIWPIPISAISSSDPNNPCPSRLIDSKSGEILVRGAKDGWIKLNPSSVGLYRTAYSPEMTEKLISALSDQTLQAMDRLGLQYDQFALCQAGKVSTVALLNLLKAYENETNYNVWSSIDECMGKLSTLFAGAEFKDKFMQFGRNLYSKVFKKFTWDAETNEKHTDPMIRALIINRLVSLEDQDVIEEAKRRFKAQSESDSKPITADLRGAVYRAISIFGSDEDFDNLFNIYKGTDLNEEKLRALGAICSARDSKRRERSVEFLFSDEVRKQDLTSALSNMTRSDPEAAWKVFQEHDLLKRLGSCLLLTALVKNITKDFVTEAKALEVIEFFKKNKYPGCERTIKQSVETIRISASWLARDSEALKKYFSS